MCNVYDFIVIISSFFKSQLQLAIKFGLSRKLDDLLRLDDAAFLAKLNNWLPTRNES